MRAAGGARPQVDQRESWGNTAQAGDSRLWDSLLQGAESRESRKAWEIARPPSLPPAWAAGRSHRKRPFEWEVLLPSLLMSSANHSWKPLSTCFLWGEPALWPDGQGCAAPGCPPDPFAIYRQGSDGPHIPGLLMLHPAGSFRGPGASVCRSPLTQGCTPGLGV